MKIKNFVLILVTLTIAVIFMSSFMQQKPWVIPDKYKSMKNPVKSSATSISDGKYTYDNHCKSCHGNKGKGDGVKAKTLKTIVNDLTAPKAQEVTDGEMYYQSFIGRDEMPNFEKKIPEETDRWDVINYVRSLKK